MRRFCVLCLLVVLLFGRSFAQGEESPCFCFPQNPEVKALHKKAMGLAVKFSHLVYLRSKLQVELAHLEEKESYLKYERIKYRYKYYLMRNLVQKKLGKNKDVICLLKKHDEELENVEDLIKAEEKIDCYHTILERKRKAMEEYQWSLLDSEHPLIMEYLSDLPYKGHEKKYKELYGEIIKNYQKFISENEQQLKVTRRIISEKKERNVILQRIVSILKGLCKEIAPHYQKASKM